MDVSPLQNIKVLDKLPPRELNGLASVLQERRWKSGDTVIRQGTPSDGVYIILTGAIRITRITSTGAHVILNELGPGAMFGTLSTIDGGLRGADCTALSNTTTAYLQRGDFQQFITEKHALALGFQVAVIRSIFGDIRRTNDQLAELTALEHIQDICLISE